MPDGQVPADAIAAAADAAPELDFHGTAQQTLDAEVKKYQADLTHAAKRCASSMRLTRFRASMSYCAVRHICEVLRVWRPVRNQSSYLVASVWLELCHRIGNPRRRSHDFWKRRPRARSQGVGFFGLGVRRLRCYRGSLCGSGVPARTWPLSAELVPWAQAGDRAFRKARVVQRPLTVKALRREIVFSCRAPLPLHELADAPRRRASGENQSRPTGRGLANMDRATTRAASVRLSRATPVPCRALGTRQC